MSQSRQYYVYIMACPNGRALYTAVTGDLIRRLYTHKSKTVNGFTKKYNACKLVYYETTNDIWIALEREKQIKAGARKKKPEMINQMNPNRDDLYGKLLLVSCKKKKNLSSRGPNPLGMRAVAI